MITVPLAPDAQAAPTPSGSCEITLTTNSTIQTSAGKENRVTADGIMSLGVQNFITSPWGTNSATPKFRPWVEMRPEAGRLTENTDVDFQVEGGSGSWTWLPSDRGFGSPTIAGQFPVEDHNGRGFTVDVSELQATGNRAGALWEATGPATSIKTVPYPNPGPGTPVVVPVVEGEEMITGTVTATTTLQPFVRENTDCQAIELDSTGVTEVSANGSSQGTGVMVGNAGKEDYSRLEAVVVDPVTGTPIDGATAVIDQVTGEISVMLPEGFEGSSVDVRVTANPRGDVSADAPAGYTTPEVIGTVNVPVGKTAPGSSVNGTCVAAAGGLSAAALLALPLALATQVNVPGLTPMVEQAEDEVKEINNRLQQATGIHDPQLARLAEELNLGAIVGGAAALAALLGLVSVCSPSSSSGSSLGSSGSSSLSPES